MRLIIQPDYQSVSQWAAHYVAAKIKAANPTPEKPFVLGCPTGSSPLGMYKALIDLNKKGIVSFQNVVTFNMDEYVGLPKEHPESYYSFMWNNFFSHIDIKPEKYQYPERQRLPTSMLNVHVMRKKSSLTAVSTSSWVVSVPTDTSLSTNRALPCRRVPVRKR